LEAARWVFQQLPEARLLIVGDGPLLENLKTQAAHLRINNNVIFTGPRTDIVDILTSMDLFVSSSLWEGLPTVLLESMACNIPIVATDIPGTNELLQNNFNGVLVPPQQADKLGAAIIHILCNPDFQKVLINNEQQTLKDFSIQNIKKEYETLYRSIAKKIS
jgi:glycosyltransferase involved in cell wall biosynthesis